jgi:hypothetical protein
MQTYIKTKINISLMFKGEQIQRPVKAFGNGDFAIHQGKSYWEPAGTYVVTHIPTGFVCFRAPTLPKAKRICDYLSEVYAPYFKNLEKKGENNFNTEHILNMFKADTEFLNILKENSLPVSVLMKAGIKPRFQW